MKKYLLTAVCFLLYSSVIAQNNTSSKVDEYISRYKDWAIEEQNRTGVPAAIKLAQGIYETGAGESDLCIKANNHFGIKCKSTWTGKTFTHTDDAPDECFRSYDDSRASYTDHSDFLKNNKRYAPLFTYATNDYKKWCYGLKSCGYATNIAYAHRLIKIIEDYNLNEYTLLAMSAAPKEIIPVADKPLVHFASFKEEEKKKQVENVVVQYNNLKAVYCKKGTALLDVAIKYDLRYAKLLEINDLPDAPLSHDMFIYLERKPTKALRNSHLVLAGENMLLIAQKEGIQLESLRRYNQMKKNEEPLPGTELHLQEYGAEKPQVTVIEIEKEKPTFAKSGNSKSEVFIADNQTTDKDNAQKNPDPIQQELNLEQNSNAKIVEEITEDKPNKQRSQPRINRLPTKKRETPNSNGVINIADEKTVFEEMRTDGSNNPRFVDVEKLAQQEAEEKQMEERRQAELQRKEAESKLIEKSTEQSSSANPEPANELDALKIKLDRIVYAKPTSSATPLAKPKVGNENENTLQAVSTTKFHTVKNGETAFGIAKKYGITMKNLVDWNKLDFEQLQVGMKLIVAE